jgi:hypothetical protein
LASLFLKFPESIGVSGEFRSRRRGLFETCKPDGFRKFQKQAGQLRNEVVGPIGQFAEK